MNAFAAITGGIGLFLLGMAVMTDGLKGLAGSALRRVLATAAATPLRGTFWGAAVTLLVQSSSATTMTTIGLVSAGLLSFQQGLSLVFGASIGTTGTGWLVALLGVKVSLTAAAMPLLCAGALMRLLGRGRWSSGGAALAGFALLLVGLTTLQDGMGGLRERLNPAHLPAVGGAGVGFLKAAVGVVLLVGAGVVMTTVMQSSSAAVALSLSALHAGAISADQAVALVIGQNVGTAVSSAVAAIGTTTPARRTAVAYILFKLFAATVALATFPLAAPAVAWAARRFDPTILLATYHTAFNVAGVALLSPMLGAFARLVERIVPQRGPVLTRYLDRSVLTIPPVATEAARRTVAAVMAGLCEWAIARIGRREPAARGETVGVPPAAALEALEDTRMFLSNLAEPPASAAEQHRLAAAVHALDHVSRLAEALQARPTLDVPPDGEAEKRAAALCAEAMRAGAALAARTGAAGVASGDEAASPDAGRIAADLARISAELADLRRAHRRSTLEATAAGAVNAAQAMARVELVRELDRLAYHVARAAAHMAGAPDGADEQLRATAAEAGAVAGGDQPGDADGA